MSKTIKIIHGDCLSTMQSFPDSHFDTIVTSPPYNLKIEYNYYKDNKDYNDYLEWMLKITKEFKRILKDEGSIFLNIGSTSLQPWLAFDLANQVRDILYLQNNIIWVKAITIDKNYGHIKPKPRSKRFLNQHYENILHFTKTGNITIDRKSISVPIQEKRKNRWKYNGESGIDPGYRCLGNVWYISYETIEVKKRHPAAFPVKLPELCIKLSGVKENMMVLDPFLGSGSTLIACKKLGISGIGIDIDEEYCKISQERLDNEV